MAKNKAFLSTLFCAMLLGSASLAMAATNEGIEAQVRASFSDMPDMITIAQCESGFRQFGPNGSPLRGGSGRQYVGIFQIGYNLHNQRALSMAYDINTVEGNIAYARHMYFASGTNPWKSCLSGAAATPAPAAGISPAAAPSPVQTPAPAPVTGQLTANLNMGVSSPQVFVLQQILNRLGFQIAASGPGSPGSETNFFGALTREAVRKYQCSKGIACDGSESTTGFGRVGPMTRRSLNSQ